MFWNKKKPSQDADNKDSVSTDVFINEWNRVFFNPALLTLNPPL